MFVLPGGMGSGFGEGRAWLQGFRRFFEALFSSARAGEFVVLSGSHAWFVLKAGMGSGFGEAST
jgi:hypothetical protein